jgi:DNA-binding PadR family transcriptional regulator
LSLKYSLLALLSYGPATGYDLHKMYPKPLRPTIGFIYRALTAMEKEDLVESIRVNQEKRPDRNVFSLTESGKAEFINWLSTPLHFKLPRNTIMVQLGFGNLIGKAAMLNNIRTHREEIRKTTLLFSDAKQWDYVMGKKKKTSKAMGDPYIQLMYESSMDMLNLQILWLDTVEKKLLKFKE